MKPETELKDVFKYLKPALLLHQTEGKTKKIEDLELNVKTKHYTKDVFYLTKPFTGITKKEAAFLFNSYLVIRALRTQRQNNTKKVVLKENKDRIWPLPLETYNRLAKKIYVRQGSLTFGKRRIDGVIFGEPITTFSNYVAGRVYPTPVIIKRLIGIKPVRFEDGIILTTCIDSHNEAALASWRQTRHRSR